MVEYKSEKDREYELQSQKYRLISKIKELQAVERSNSLRLETNIIRRDINAFYQYLLMDYESRELRKDGENNLLKKFLLGVDLKAKEAMLRFYFHSIDLEDLLMEEYNLLEQYKGLCDVSSWCREGIANASDEISNIRSLEKNYKGKIK